MADQNDSNELRDRSLGELMKRLADETGTLVRQEIDLAKAEMREKGQKVGAGAGFLVGAGLVGLLALGSLTAFLILALDGVIPNWLAALIVGLVYAAIAAYLAVQGREKLREAGRPVPEQTQATIEEDLEWAKNQVRSSRR
jgi:uncharacterized membrane protein YqjE